MNLIRETSTVREQKPRIDLRSMSDRMCSEVVEQHYIALEIHPISYMVAALSPNVNVSNADETIYFPNYIHA